MMLMALMDQMIDPEELAVIDRFAKAWSIDEPRLKNLHQFVDGHHTRMKLDLLRRGFFGQRVLKEAWEREGDRASLRQGNGPRARMEVQAARPSARGHARACVLVSLHGAKVLDAGRTV